jgi:superfamily II DNA helicase RecQ
LRKTSESGHQSKSLSRWFRQFNPQNARYFINDDCQVVCATIALGMGIDKSNVRWVSITSQKKNIEGYYQEIVAGRDGLPSETYCFESYGDVIQLQKLPHRA